MRGKRWWLLAIGGVAACARAPAVPGGPLDDRQLASLIELRLSSDRRLCPYALHATATNGVVRLGGLVSNDVDRRRAVQIAESAGARKVKSELVLSAGSGDGGRC